MRPCLQMSKHSAKTMEVVVRGKELLLRMHIKIGQSLEKFTPETEEPSLFVLVIFYHRLRCAKVELRAM